MTRKQMLKLISVAAALSVPTAALATSHAQQSTVERYGQAAAYETAAGDEKKDKEKKDKKDKGGYSAASVPHASAGGETKAY